MEDYEKLGEQYGLAQGDEYCLYHDSFCDTDKATDEGPGFEKVVRLENLSGAEGTGCLVPGARATNDGHSRWSIHLTKQV